MYGSNAINRKILNLSDSLLERIQKANLCTPALVLKTPNSKFRKLGFDVKEIELIRDAVLSRVIPKSYTAAEISCAIPQRWKRIKCCCEALDKILANGIPTTGITEICGESGSGKSQICFQLAISVQLPERLGGLGKGAVYISTENPLPTPRLCQIANYFASRHKKLIGDINFTDNIYVQDLYSGDKLLECITDRLPLLMRQNPIGIIIIDSIAAPFRTENNFIKRAKNFRLLANALKKLSDEHHCAIVCTNQVASNINQSNQSNSQLIPCLGLAWANLVNTRLQIHKTNRMFQLRESEFVEEIPVRQMEILFAPDLKPNVAEFLITSNGVKDLTYF